MKQYGMNKATEFTRKQIGVIYAAAKRGDLKVEKWVVNEFYDLADYYGYDDNRMVEFAEKKILMILDAIFGKDMGRAQELINLYTETEMEGLSASKAAKLNRALVA